MTPRPLSTVALFLLTVAVTGVWWAGMRAFRIGEVLPHVGLCACGLLAVVGPLARGRLAPLLRVDRRTFVVAGAGAALMLLGTYAGYPLATRFWPELTPGVASLYRGLAAPTPWVFLWLVPIVAAEEVVFRGLWVDVIGAERPLLAGVGAVAAFAAAQTGASSLLVVLLAVSCGAVWVAQRFLSGSLVAPLLTHALWNLSVLVLWPLSA